MADYKLYYYIISEFSKFNKWSILGLITISVGINLTTTYGVSKMIAQLYDIVKTGSKTIIWRTFYYLIFFYILSKALYYIFYEIEKGLVQNVRAWSRYKLIDLVMTVNNNVFSEINFATLNSPVHRTADLIGYIIDDVVGYLIPNILMLAVINIYFAIINPTLSIAFFIANIVILLIYYIIFPELINENMKYEKSTVTTDGTMIDLFNNMDKVIYRGKSEDESKNMYKLANESSTLALNYYNITRKFLKNKINLF